MTPKPRKKSVLMAISLLLFFLSGGLAWSATPTPLGPQQPLNNAFTGPVPAKPAAPITGPPAGIPGQGVVSGNPATPNCTSGACPLDLSTGPKGDIRDIRGPIHIPDPRLWLFYTLGAMLLALLAWAAWKWFRKRRPFRSKAAFEIAFEELEKAKNLMTPEMAEKFSVMVSNTIRTYIEKRFSLRATRKTTHEFITQVAAEPSSELNQHSVTLRSFLVHCDLAKFARQTFSREQMEKMHRSAWRFVEETQTEPLAAGGR